MVGCFVMRRFRFSIIMRAYSTSSVRTISKPTAPTANKSVAIQIMKHGRNGNIREAESLFRRIPEKNVFVYTAMLTAYVNNGQITNARKEFDEMPVRDKVSHSVMIKGFVNAGRLGDAERLFGSTPLEWRDPFCSTIMMKGYFMTGNLEEAVRVFEGMVEKDVVSWNTMVDGYCKNDRLSEARKLFDIMGESKDGFVWSSMIVGYMKSHYFEDGILLFLQMRREGSVQIEYSIMTVIFESCGRIGREREGWQVHGFVSRMGFEDDMFVCNSMIAMYSRFGCTDEARSLFNMMSKRNIVSWNSLIGGYVQAGMIEEANELFERMDPKDVVSWTTMISGFANRGLTEKCISLFLDMPERNCVSWTSVISGFVNNGEDEEAISWFVQMVRSAMRPDAVTFVSLLSASASLVSLSLGSQLHGFVVKLSMEYDLSIQTSLVTVYSKCGNVDDAYKTFKSITRPGIASFDAMIIGFAHNGCGEEALDLFRKLIDAGLDPSEFTFTGVLSACRHAGLVEEGCQLFKSMSTLFKVEPNNFHYAIMVDLLGKAGLLDEATKLIESMPFETDIVVWISLLDASRTHMRPDIAKLASQNMLQLDPESVTTHMPLSERLPGTRNRQKGCSWITVNEKKR